VIVASLFTLAAFYGYGVRRAALRRRAPKPAAVAAFALGLAVTGGVLCGPMDDLSDASLSWHMVQHLALAFIVAPLLLLGAPIRLALAAFPAGGATRLARWLGSPAVRAVTHPACALLQFTAVLYAVHFSPLYEAALEHEPIHAFEHVVLLASALVFWTPILAVAPAPHAPAHAVRLLMLFLALPMSAFLGFILYVMRRPLYPHYALLPGALGDQQNAGAVMWIAGGGPVLIALLWCVADWGTRERRLGLIADRADAT
jgi:cytochrome c oxidase assembly factor CtaG